jgi:hypothetical protein
MQVLQRLVRQVEAADRAADRASQLAVRQVEAGERKEQERRAACAKVKSSPS